MSMSMADSVRAAGEVEEALRESVEGRQFGTIEVRKIIALLGEDADGQTAVYLELILSDPTGATWPIEDAQQLRRAIREQLVSEPPGLPFYVTLRPENEAPQADEDAEGSN